MEALKKYVYVERNGWKLVGIVKDIASGLKEDRRGLWKLIEMAKEHEFDILLVAYKDRLTRFRFKYLDELFKAYGVKVISNFSGATQRLLSGASRGLDRDSYFIYL